MKLVLNIWMKQYIVGWCFMAETDIKTLQQSTLFLSLDEHFCLHSALIQFINSLYLIGNITITIITEAPKSRHYSNQNNLVSVKQIRQLWSRKSKLHSNNRKVRTLFRVIFHTEKKKKTIENLPFPIEVKTDSESVSSLLSGLSCWR